jgi:hypothetical protein
MIVAPNSPSARGRVLQVAVHGREPGARRPDVERGGDEGLGEDDRHGREGDLDPERVQRPAQHPLAAEHQEQGQTGDRWRQHDGQVDGGLDQACAAEPSPGEEVRQRRPEGEGQGDGHGRGHEAQRQGIADGLVAKRVREGRPAEGPGQQRRDRQAEEGDEPPGQREDRRPTPHGWVAPRKPKEASTA